MSSKSKLSKQYVPKSLSPADKKKQIESIKKKTIRPKIDFDSRRSTHVTKFEKKYGYKISDLKRVAKEIISKEGIDKIMAKGRGAYFSSGSRPNQTPESWSLARLASVIMNGKARRIDIDLWNKYKI